MITNLVSYVVLQLVENKDAVQVDLHKSETVLTVNISVAEEDKGRVFGKDCGVIKSLTTILNTISAKRVKVKVI